MLRLLLGLLLTIAVAHVWWSDREIARPPGPVAPAEPVQENLKAGPTWEIAGHAVTALARFAITARVLGSERYRRDREAALAPIDLALGWGPMSDSRVLADIDISQYGRFYFWETSEPLIDPSEIISHSANMHLIPASDAVRETLFDARRGHVVALRGWLVEVTDDDGWRWKSSLRRDDDGGGACEIVLVESAALR